MTAFNMEHGGNAPEKNFNAKDERKLRKPLIEKRRRERINCSLEQLKGIIVDAYNLDQSKLEKADVLEVTVQHMEGLQKGHGPGIPAGPSVGFQSRQRYSSGYIQCMQEVHNLLLGCPGMDKPLGAQLLNHLLKSLPHISSETGPGNTGGNGPDRTPTRPITGGVNGNKGVNRTLIKAIGNCNGSIGCGGSSSSNGASPNSGPGSPPQSPLSLPSGGVGLFQPCRLQMHHASPPLTTPTRCPPLHAPHRRVHSGRDEREQLPASSPSSPPNLPQPGVFHPAPLPPFFGPVGDPSMWRPW
ncbi:transcription cofactor HES-6-like [Salvelinus namaycush]|uniref:Transcription cofactor HES-6-like n=1 Tax=Salvelinus namaycush TaxID=8040 RepID=A0A8U0TY13_SALNM|nr:transcription cofactor HES-6-like [Salvelinus namaycush]